MSEFFIGQITLFAGNFAPRGWAFCEGQLLPISQNEALFSILGTTYGGDGRNTFALPDLRGRVPVHPGHGPGLSDYTQGQMGGSETNTLTVVNLPAHSHSVPAFTKDVAGGSSGIVLEEGDPATATTVTSGNTGGNQPVNNLQPYTAINYIIALVGIYPSRS